MHNRADQQQWDEAAGTEERTNHEWTQMDVNKGM
jgi:hypothetical protein